MKRQQRTEDVCPPFFYGYKQKRSSEELPFQLDYQDSNLEKQDQNLLCYHYTIVQSFYQNHPSRF